MDETLSRITIDHQLETPLSLQLKQQIIWLIAIGHFKPDDQLPSVRLLAQHLNININTVRVAYQRLERDGLVETRQGKGTRVLRIEPRRLAMVAGNQRTHTIGVILPDFSNPFYHDFLQGVEEISRQDQSMLFICNSHESLEEVFQIFTQLSAKHVDGIILASEDDSQLLADDSSLSQQTFSGIPLVSVDWPESQGFSILLDLENAGYLATRHLIQHGHTRIGLITYEEDVSNIHSINAGYQKALDEASLKSDPDLIARLPTFDMNAGAEGTRMLLALDNPPSAIFTVADTLALGVLHAIKTAGLQIPQNIALTSFNNIAFAEVVDPPLTTVTAPARQMGSEAMIMLRDLIERKQPPRRQVILPTSLIVRNSCGCK